MRSSSGNTSKPPAHNVFRPESAPGVLRPPRPQTPPARPPPRQKTTNRRLSHTSKDSQHSYCGYSRNHRFTDNRNDKKQSFGKALRPVRLFTPEPSLFRASALFFSVFFVFLQNIRIFVPPCVMFKTAAALSHYVRATSKTHCKRKYSSPLPQLSAKERGNGSACSTLKYT